MQNVDIISRPAVFYLPIDNILPNPYEPRRRCDTKLLKELTASVKRYGIIEPVTVRMVGGKYELVNGHRRVRAGKMAGLAEIPAVVVAVNDRDCAVVSAVENLHRERINYFDLALAFKAIMEDFGYNTEELAQMLCLSRDFVEEKLRLLSLSKEIKSQLLRLGLSEEYGVIVACMEKPEKQKELLSKIEEQGLDVKSALKLMEGMKNGQPKMKVKKCFKDIRLFINTVKQATEIMCASGVETSYIVEQKDKGCEIRIFIQQ